MSTYSTKKDKYKIKIIDGQQLLVDQNDVVVYGQVFTRVTDKVGEKPYAIVKLLVDLEGETNEK